MRLMGKPGAGEPGALQPALHLGRRLEETGPREGSRLPNPEAQPGLPAPSGGLRNLRLVGTVPEVRGGGAARPACSRQLPARPSWCPFADAAVGRPPAPALCSANLPEWRCGRGQFGKLVVERGCPGYAQEWGKRNWGIPNPSWMEPGSNNNNKVNSNCEHIWSA